jgi:tetratricopeptide (TPR) repeat protein
VAGILLAQVAGFAVAQYREGRKVWLQQAALKDVVAAASKDPNDSALTYTAAFRLWQNGRPKEALPLAERAARTAPRLAVAQLLLGYIYAHEGRAAEGLLKYWEALRLDPKLEAAHSSVGQLCLQVGLPDEAIPHLLAARNERRPNAASIASLIQAYTAHGDYDQAESMCREFMDYLPPHDIHGFRMLYHIAKPRGRTVEVEKEMLARLKQNRWAPRGDFYAFLAYVVLESSHGRRIAEAAQWAERAARKRPEMGQAFEMLGMVRLRQGRLAEAERALRHGLELSPGDSRIRPLLAETLRRLGREGEARKYQVRAPTANLAARSEPMRRRVENNSHDLQARIELAQFLERGGDPAAGFRVCRPALDAQPPDPALLDLANRCLRETVEQSVEEW